MMQAPRTATDSALLATPTGYQRTAARKNRFFVCKLFAIANAIEWIPPPRYGNKGYVLEENDKAMVLSAATSGFDSQRSSMTWISVPTYPSKLPDRRLSSISTLKIVSNGAVISKDPVHLLLATRVPFRIWGSSPGAGDSLWDISCI